MTAPSEGDRLTISEAATLLGVHRNTIRNRIKLGRYKAHKVLTPQGETYVIERASVLPDLHNTASQPPLDTVHHKSAPSEGTTLPSLTEQQAAVDATIQRLLEPFVRDLAAAHQTIGRLEAERDSERRRADDLQAQIDALRSPETSDNAATGSPVSNNTSASPEPEFGPWQRFRAWLRRETP